MRITAQYIECWQAQGLASTTSRALARLTLVLLLIIASGCATQPPRDDSPKTAEQTLALNTWHAKGKIGIRHRGKAQSAYFDWNNKRQAYEIRLSGALGVGAAKLVKKGNQVKLSTKDGKFKGHSAEDIMQQTLGWSIPVSEFAFWIKGLSAPLVAADNSSISEDGALQTLEQMGWRIRYAKYERIYGHLLPGKVIAERDDIKITLAIKNWKL